jgi:hypothetical protein
MKSDPAFVGPPHQSSATLAAKAARVATLVAATIAVTLVETPVVAATVAISHPTKNLSNPF